MEADLRTLYFAFFSGLGPPHWGFWCRASFWLSPTVPTPRIHLPPKIGTLLFPRTTSVDYSGSRFPAKNSQELGIRNDIILHRYSTLVVTWGIRERTGTYMNHILRGLVSCPLKAEPSLSRMMLANRCCRYQAVGVSCGWDSSNSFLRHRSLRDPRYRGGHKCNHARYILPYPHFGPIYYQIDDIYPETMELATPRPINTRQKSCTECRRRKQKVDIYLPVVGARRESILIKVSSVSQAIIQMALAGIAQSAIHRWLASKGQGTWSAKTLISNLMILTGSTSLLNQSFVNG